MGKREHTAKPQSDEWAEGLSDDVNSTNSQFRLYKERWFISVAVALLPFGSGLFFASFAPIVNIAAGYYKTSADAINWLTTVFFITDAVFTFPAMFIMNKYGLRSVIYVASFSSIFGSAIRMLGTSELISHNHRYLITIIGQTIASITIPFIMCAPTALSQQWFPHNQRIFITTLCSMTTMLGCALASITSAHLVPESSQMYIMNYGFGVFNIIAGLIGVFVRHSKPPTPPSVSASLEMSANHHSSFISQLKSIIKNKDFLLLSICGGGLATGVCAVIMTLTQQLICPWGYSNTFAGLLGWFAFFSGIVGSFIIGCVAERFNKYEEVMMIAFATYGFLGGLLIWILRIPHFEVAIVILYIIFGLTSVGVLPTVMELSVETTYPVNEGVAGNAVIFSGQLQAAILLPLSSLFARPMNGMENNLETCTTTGLTQALDLTNSMIFLAVVNTAECLVLILFCRPKYKRREAEQLKTKQTPAQNSNSETLPSTIPHTPIQAITHDITIPD